MKNETLGYSIGPLLYCPANNKSLTNSIINGDFGSHFSLALCLEDTIPDALVSEAENMLIQTIKTIFNSSQSIFVPKLFIRVRNSSQITNLYTRLGEAAKIITGFILPKFSLENADSYINALIDINKNSDQDVYCMPILESPNLVNLKSRYDILYELKDKIDKISNFVVNVRVGGNDLCHVFGFRRNVNQSIHDIKPIANILSDIVTIFGLDYIISGPVWEFYNGEGWELGLKNEIEEDRLNGFVGKTVIHPNQIPIVNESYKVSKADYGDAVSILNWTSENSLVSGSISKERMNEFKTHKNWATKICHLANAYGIKE